MSSMFWGHVAHERISRAYQRLVAYHTRHAIPLDAEVVGAADGWPRDQARAINRILIRLWKRDRYHGALRVFRRAVDSTSATGLHVNSGGTVQYLR